MSLTEWSNPFDPKINDEHFSFSTFTLSIRRNYANTDNACQALKRPLSRYDVTMTIVKTLVSATYAFPVLTIDGSDHKCARKYRPLSVVNT